MSPTRPEEPFLASVGSGMAAGAAFGHPRVRGARVRPIFLNHMSRICPLYSCNKPRAPTWMDALMELVEEAQEPSPKMAASLPLEMIGTLSLYWRGTSLSRSLRGEVVESVDAHFDDQPLRVRSPIAEKLAHGRTRRHATTFWGFYCGKR